MPSPQAFKSIFKQILFVIFSSLTIYLLIHLQFLLGMPQAALSLLDISFVLVTATMSYILSRGKKLYYFLGLFIVFLPVFEFQYWYIKIFSKAFLLDEMKHFHTLLQVSPLPKKIAYGSLFLIWCASLIMFLYNMFKNILKMHYIAVLIVLAGVFFQYKIFTTTIERLTFFEQNPERIFFYWGAIELIQSRIPEEKLSDISEDEIKTALLTLKSAQDNRTIYPISESPAKAPEKLRPIFIFVLESFYDFHHFYSYFDTNPFPQEYLDLVSTNAYTGPNQNFGSFYARINMLTSAKSDMEPMINPKNDYLSLPNLLKDYGYSTYALEAVNQTYAMKTYYRLWGVDKAHFLVYGNSWEGKLPPENYFNNAKKIIYDTPKDQVPFYFGFTYLEHDGSCDFTDQYPDPSGINNFLAKFPAESREQTKKIVKASVFNAERILKLRNMILQKYPDALILFKSDHYSVNWNKFLKESHFDESIKAQFFNDPAPMTGLLFDGTNGKVDLPYGTSPSSFPLILLAKAGLPYKDTIQSLFMLQTPKDVYLSYGQLWEKNNSGFEKIMLDKFPDLKKQITSVNKISLDLYKGKNFAISNLNLLQQ